MRSFEAAARIDASPEEVWALLVEVGGWRDWDSGVDRVEGRVALGERLTLYATMIRTHPFVVTVTEIGPRELMRWRGGLPLGLAVIERTYSLAGQEGGGHAPHRARGPHRPAGRSGGPLHAGPEPLVPVLLRGAQGPRRGAHLPPCALTGRRTAPGAGSRSSAGRSSSATCTPPR
jgi:hypothetical protein